METKIDVSKLITVNEYARKKKITTATVYMWIKNKDKRIEFVEIAGKLFIQI